MPGQPTHPPLKGKLQVWRSFENGKSVDIQEQAGFRICLNQGEHFCVAFQTDVVDATFTTMTGQAATLVYPDKTEGGSTLRAVNFLDESSVSCEEVACRCIEDHAPPYPDQRPVQSS